MTQLTRAQLDVIIQANVSTNGRNLDTAALLREVLGDMVDSTEFIFGDSGAILGLGITRAQISTNVIPTNAFIAAGYATVGDDGAGAPYIRGTSTGLLAIQDSSGTWWNLLNLGFLKWGWFGATGDNATDDSAAIIACCSAVSSFGGGVSQGNARKYFINSSINITGMSNIAVQGLGLNKTTIRCGAGLNGSNNFSKNDLICALNFGSTAPYQFKNITVSDLTLDCTNQNTSGIITSGGGFNLCGIELQNVDYVTIERVRIIRAFGNGAVCGSLDPHASQAVTGCVIRDSTFDTCVNGVLPQYTSSTSPAGVTGNAIQMGAANHCSVLRNTFTNCGGDAVEIDNFSNGFIEDNYISGVNNTPVGASFTNTTFYQQTVGGIRAGASCFNTVISGNRLIGAGGISLNGDVGGSYGGGSIKGPTYNQILNNVIIQSYGPVAIPTGVPAFPLSGVGYTNPHSQPLLVYISGGSVSSVTVQRAGGSPASQAAGPSAGYAMAAGDTIVVTYTGSPTWNVLLAPNLFQPGLFLNGGSSGSSVGQAQFNTISGNVISLTGKEGIFLLDSSLNIINNNTVQDVCQTSVLATTGSDYVAFLLNTSSNTNGAGCSNNDIYDNVIIDDRSPQFLAYNYQDDAPGGVTRCLTNSFSRNRLETASASSIATNSPTNTFDSNRISATGPGWVSNKQFRAAMTSGQLNTVNTAIGGTITTGTYIEWNNSDRIYFNTSDALYIAIKSALTFTDAQMATLYLAAIVLPQ